MDKKLKSLVDIIHQDGRRLRTLRPMTEEEEADEIIRRLSTPPRKTISGLELEKFIIEQLAKDIATEIDKEIYATLACQKKK